MTENADMNMDELFATWTLCLSRIKWQKEREAATTRGDEAAAQIASEALERLPEVSPLNGLRANADLVGRLTVQRFIAMKVAQEQGASADLIGKALGVSRQSAWEFMKRRIAEHGGEPPEEKLPPIDDPRKWQFLQKKIEEHLQSAADAGSADRGEEGDASS